MPQKLFTVRVRGTVDRLDEIESPEIKKALEEGYTVKQIVPVAQPSAITVLFAIVMVVLEKP